MLYVSARGYTSRIGGHLCTPSMEENLSHFESQSAELKVAKDRVSRVVVNGLFGLFDHDIPLNLNSGLTIMHGPNGVGKTIVLRMIEEIVSGNPKILHKIPYEDFTITFQSGDRVTVSQTKAQTGDDGRRINYSASIAKEEFNVDNIAMPDTKLVEVISKYMEPAWQYQGDGTWIDRRDGEVLGIEEASHRFPIPRSLRQGVSAKRDERLEKLFVLLRGKCQIRLIGTNRLLTGPLEVQSGRLGARRWYSQSDLLDDSQELSAEVSADFSGSRNFPESTIKVYSKDLRHRAKSVLTNYGKLTESLDRSLVRRLIRRSEGEKSPAELLAIFKQLDGKRRSLVELGLLTGAEDIIGPGAADSDVLSLVSTSGGVFSLYVQDMQQKLALFDELQRKLEILRDRTHRRFQFKKMIFNADDGILFESDSGEKIQASDLSSGEQHEMILLYELLFVAKPGDLVLIDEPEISLHLEWQMEFLSDIGEVLNASSVDVLMATHSVSIARGAREGLVPLGPRGR